MIYERNSKYKKFQKRRLKGFNVKKTFSKVKFGGYYVKSLETGILTALHLETLRRIIVRETGRKSKIWFRVKPTRVFSSKKKLERMGKGKGKPRCWVFCIKAGQILFEFEDIFFNTNLSKLDNNLNSKLPFKIKLFKNRFFE